MSSTTATTVPRREVWDSRQTILQFQPAEENEVDPRTLTVPAAYDAFLLPYQHRNSDAQRASTTRCSGIGKSLPARSRLARWTATT